ncbi:Inner membrane transport protein YnfM [Pigmentiphaga humi]|uniref:Inner membrane transport protein YnfM n=1 Tax=Pigmentiphaga humi TaxID=2478468 RepID=A0A3P4B077_9BURK|nr:MFS transporter [Pigmentiphaga humi]VCU69703.1 Inner membrane transport protein YnfM [Pigmentiphaga humi]
MPPAVPPPDSAPASALPPAAARAAATPRQIGRGTPAFWRAVVALFASGFSTFSLLYFVQPLLPLFAEDFGLSPAGSSLAISLTTAVLAVAMLAVSMVSERLGRRPLMAASLLSSAALTTAMVLFPQWPSLLVMRTLMGVTLSGLPAVAMAYVGEEIEPRAAGLAMGLYIGGSAIGGMSGRLLAGVIAEYHGWQGAALTIGLIGFAGTALFWRMLPPSRNFQPRPLNVRGALGNFRIHLCNPAMLRLFAQGFLIMGGFVAVYNYIGFRLLGAPFFLGHAVVGMVSIVYLAGIFSSAWMGDLAARHGRGRVMTAGVLLQLAGTLLTLSASLWLVVLGMAILTFGFFGAHSICSTWVARLARQGRAQATSLYLFGYYCGSALIGMGVGYALDLAGWGLFIGMVAVLLALALANAVIQTRRDTAS